MDKALNYLMDLIANPSVMLSEMKDPPSTTRAKVKDSN